LSRRVVGVGFYPEQMLKSLFCSVSYALSSWLDP